MAVPGFLNFAVAHGQAHAVSVCQPEFCSPVVVQYIEEVNPRTMDRPPFMHGFLVGLTCLISEGVQLVLHQAFSVDMPHMP